MEIKKLKMKAPRPPRPRKARRTATGPTGRLRSRGDGRIITSKINRQYRSDPNRETKGERGACRCTVYRYEIYFRVVHNHQALARGLLVLFAVWTASYRATRLACRVSARAIRLTIIAARSRQDAEAEELISELPKSDPSVSSTTSASSVP